MNQRLTGRPQRPLHAKRFFPVYSCPDVTEINELIVRSYVPRNAKYRNQDRYAAYIGFPAYATIQKMRLAPSRFQSLPFYSIIYAVTTICNSAESVVRRHQSH